MVIAKDTPNFIANHIGLYGVMQIFRAWTAGGFTIEEIDAITGPAIGRPKSATFRTVDIAGIDVLAHVIRNLAERLPDDESRALFTLPPVVEELVARGWIGAKAGQGFYKKDADGEILTLDPASMTYRPKQSARLRVARCGACHRGSGGAGRQAVRVGKDKVGAFLRDTLGPTLVYTARVTPDIAHSIDDVDRAMRWGFGWELGPFETWDAIGVAAVADACQLTCRHPSSPGVADGASRAAARNSPRRVAPFGKTASSRHCRWCGRRVPGCRFCAPRRSARRGRRNPGPA